MSDWAVAMAGECGEACNIVKKLNRNRDGIRGNTENPMDLRVMLAEEIADTVTYAFLLADKLKIDMEEALREKFNKVSRKNNFDYLI